MKDITALIVNYRTAELTARCVESLLAYYPDVQMILVDNGSLDKSTRYIQGMSERYDNIVAILNQVNRFHGPALDQAIRAACTRLVFALDSDCETQQPGFLEMMSAQFADPLAYAVGELVQVNCFGYPVPPAGGRPFPYVHPRRMMLDREKYLVLRPFIHHGTPGLQNMRTAVRRGYRLQDFHIQAYVTHLGRGTCKPYGYGLGLRHKVEYFLDQVLRLLARD